MQVEKLVKSQLWCLKNTTGEQAWGKKKRKMFPRQVQNSLKFQREQKNRGVSEHRLPPVS